jgi:serine/threonine-protein kinase RIO1
MPSKPNYNHQRAERDRAKKASKDIKLQVRKEQAALRKASEAGAPEPDDGTVPGAGE